MQAADRVDYALPTGSIAVRRPPGADRGDPQAARPTSPVRAAGMPHRRPIPVVTTS
jgi:hypothetical protein